MLFFLSGFSALLYQVIWQRMLALFSGVDVYSVTIIVAAFMLGLGCGSLVGGHLADRLPRRRLLQLFALSELLIAGFALCSKWLYYDVLYTTFPQLAASPVTMAAVLFLSLLFPTVFMGLTLPMLSKAVTRRADQAARRIGALYALNTLGSAVGAFVTAVVLVRQFGFEPSLRIGAALNVCAAVGAAGILWSGRRTASTEPEPAAAPAVAPPTAPAAESSAPSTGLPFPAWLAIYALSGFIALGLEIVWFRLLGVILKSNAFTFAVLLCLYLVGVGAGTLLGLRSAPTCRNPARRFLLLQAGITLYAGLSLALFVRLLGEWRVLDSMLATFARGRPLPFPFHLADLSGEFSVLYGIVAPLLILPPTLLMGASFPYLQRASQTDLSVLGRRVGWLQTANIVGATLGVVAVGALLLGWLGTSGTLRVLIGLGGVFLVLRWRLRGEADSEPARRVRRVGGVLSAGVVASVMALVPSSATLWGKLHGSTAESILFAEDATGLAVILGTEADFSGSCRTFANGIGQSYVPFGGVHTELGLLSIALHPAPLDIAIIGLGSGDTLFAAGGRAETRSITSIEIIAPELETLRQLHARRPYGGLDSILHDKRIRHVFSDGRTVVMRGEARYDVIEADAVLPVAAYSGNLYSEEYFTLLRQRLKPGGLAVTWSPTPRTRRTFAKVFPHVAGFESILVGSEQPLVFDPAEVRARMDRPDIQAYYERAGIDARAKLERLLASYRSAPPGFDRSLVQDTNSDLFPKDEYAVP